MTRKEIVSLAEEFDMHRKAFCTHDYFKKSTNPVDVDFGICSGQLYFGLIFEAEWMDEENIHLLMPIEETTVLAARTILTRLFRKAHFAMDEAECFSHA